MRLARWVWVPIVLSSATAAADDPPPDRCAALVQSVADNPTAATELALGDCYQQLGDAQQAANWYRAAARRAVHDAAPAPAPAPAPVPRDAVPAAHDAAPALEPTLVMQTEALSPPPRGWKIAAWSAVGVTALGIVMYAYGAHELNDATNKLCLGGAYASEGNPGCTPINMLDGAQVASLNSEGERGRELADIGLLTGGVAGAFAVYAVYEAYFSPRARAERAVVTPVVAPGTAGASLQLRW